MMTACIDPTVAASLQTAYDLPFEALRALLAGTLRPKPDVDRDPRIGWQFTCTADQALHIRVALCVLASREHDQESQTRLLRAERVIAGAMSVASHWSAA